MATTSSNFDETLEFVAVEAVTAGTMRITATTLIACLPLTSAGTGQTYTGKISGRVNGLTKSSETAFLTGAKIKITTAGLCLIPTAGDITNAYCAAGATTSTNTLVCDVILRAPVATPVA